MKKAHNMNFAAKPFESLCGHFVNSSNSPDPQSKPHQLFFPHLLSEVEGKSKSDLLGKEINEPGSKNKY